MSARVFDRLPLYLQKCTLRSSLSEIINDDNNTIRKLMCRALMDIAISLRSALKCAAAVERTPADADAIAQEASAVIAPATNMHAVNKNDQGIGCDGALLS